MIKVMEVSSDSNIGGAGKCILTFLKHYDRKAFSVTAVVPTGSLLKPEIEKLETPLRELPHLAEKSLDRAAIGHLRRLFQEEKPDLVHTHANMSARIAAKSLGIPVVYTRHSVFPPSKRLSTFPGKQINGWINNRTADRIIAVAEAAKENLTDTGVSGKKIQVILNGVEALPPSSAAELQALNLRYGIGEEEKVVVMAARLAEVKGHKYLVEAARRLRERGITAKFLIAGTGETEAALRAQIRDAKLEESVILMGFVEDVAPLMHRMDVQVNCSFGTEATSLALLEGMSLGKPIIASDFGGNPGVVAEGKNGFLTPVHDIEALTNRLEQLLTDADLYQQLSVGAKEIYQEKFTAEANTHAIENLYREVVCKKKKGRDLE